ncbi:MAG TPA: ABC transporter permease [Paenirhodobacter sp.]
MSGLILKRLGLGVFTLWLVSILVFAGTQVLPGDVASAILGQNATPESLAVLRRDLGLDAPLVVRYGQWLMGFVTGDMGNSLASGQPVAGLMVPRLINTLLLAGYAAVIAVPLAVTLGILVAVFRGTIFDRVLNILALACVALPEYFLGLLLVLWISVQWGWLPSLADTYPGMSLGDWLAATTLPALTLVLVTMAQMMRMTRTALLEVMDQSYVETAWLKGLRAPRVVMRHALPNAAAPIVNVVAFNIAYLITGVVLVESVFNYNGLGRFMVDAVAKRDLPLVQASALAFAAAFVLLNLVADIAAIALNPRLRHPR